MKNIILAFLFFAVGVYAQNAKEIVKKADQHMRANSSYAEIKMTVIKPDWSRTMGMKVWSLEPNYALVYITEPARDKGTVTLKRHTEVWNWIPAAQKIIKIPPSMMMQSWMGSDFTNDDLVREASIVTDYNQTLLREEKLGTDECYKILLKPKPEAGVVWDKIIMWITKENYLEKRADYYDENGDVVRRFTGSDPKEMGGRIVYTHWEMKPLDKPGDDTIMDYDKIEFNIKINQSFFSEQNMRRVR